MKRYHILVKGRVQGVGFRYHAKYAAIKTDITGWAKNLDNGDVEIEAQGDAEFLESFIKLLEKGNGFSKVAALYKTEIPLVTKEKSFNAIYY